MPTNIHKPTLIPFLVAATGHRDLRPQDLDRLRREVRAVFVGIHSRMPNTPIFLLTGLAEGADQLVAEVALEQDVRLVAALPMPIDIYKEQMTAGAQKRLEGLLTLSSVQIELPLERRTPEMIRASDEVRSECYEALARFLARYGQSLIALWDGKNSLKPGGTSSVVHYVRSGESDESSADKELLCGVVYQVVTPRMGDSTYAPEIKTIELGCERQPFVEGRDRGPTNDDAGQLSHFAQVESAFERFNRTAANFVNRGSEVKSRLIDDETMPLSNFQKTLETLYEVADRISVQANGRRKLILGAILLTAIIGTLFYGIHGEMFGTRVWLWFSFPFFVIVALVLHRTARANHVEDTYLDARALAEALRVQFFWTTAGIAEPVDRYYLVDRRAELDWIRIALKNVWLINRGRDETLSKNPNLMKVLDSWVKNQERWYGVKADRQSRSVRLREKVSKYGLLAAVLWSILVPIGIMVFRSARQSQPEWVYESLHVALAVPALLAGAYRLWIEQAGYEEQSRDYRSMEREFAIKARELEKHMDEIEIAQNLLLTLGIEALKENGRWLLMHRERPLEVLSSP